MAPGIGMVRNIVLERPIGQGRLSETVRLPVARFIDRGARGPFAATLYWLATLHRYRGHQEVFSLYCHSWRAWQACGGNGPHLVIHIMNRKTALYNYRCQRRTVGHQYGSVSGDLRALP